VYDDADKRLARISSENADVYQTLLSSLILQSLLALSDGEVVVRTREADAKTVEAALKTVSEQYTDKTDGSSLDVVVDSKRFLSENWYVVRWWVSGLSLAGVRHPVSGSRLEGVEGRLSPPCALRDCAVPNAGVAVHSGDGACGRRCVHFPLLTLVAPVVDNDLLSPPALLCRAVPPLSPAGRLHSTGGVTLFSNGGRVMLENTFESRLEIAYQQNLPIIRSMLFGEDDAAAAAESA